MTKTKISSRIVMIIMVLCILCVLIGFVIGDQSNFLNRDASEPFNITFPGQNQNITEYIEIPMYAYLDNITLTLRGIEIT